MSRNAFINSYTHILTHILRILALSSYYISHIFLYPTPHALQATGVIFIFLSFFLSFLLYLWISYFGNKYWFCQSDLITFSLGAAAELEKVLDLLPVLVLLFLVWISTQRLLALFIVLTSGSILIRLSIATVLILG